MQTNFFLAQDPLPAPPHLAKSSAGLRGVHLAWGGPTQRYFRDAQIFLLCANVVKEKYLFDIYKHFFYDTQMYFVLGLQLQIYQKTSVLS